MESSQQVQELLRQFILIEVNRLRELGPLIADRVAASREDIATDLENGGLLGEASDRARAARYALKQLLILKGVEDPGWGF